jgi:hypothetical protein
MSARFKFKKVFINKYAQMNTDISLFCKTHMAVDEILSANSAGKLTFEQKSPHR